MRARCRRWMPVSSCSRYHVPTGYAILLLAQGLTAAMTAEAMERDPHTIGRCASACGEGCPEALIFEQTGGSPRPLDQTQQEFLERGGGTTARCGRHPVWPELAIGRWCSQFVSERFGISLCRSSCLNWLYRLGFACKRPKKRLLKADECKRVAFVPEDAVLWKDLASTD